MSKVLMRRTEIWRVDTEKEAQEIIDEAAKEGDLTKKIIEVKQKKSKGQVVDENLKVTTQVDFAGQWPIEEDDD
ncbi:hypothetical protein [Phage Phass-1]|uniref:Uncharacterized protein n=1 Tax=Phage Phass-1 TaxID=3043662 RepID=A0AAF0LTX0_9CAUD|nr:hypothetical protein [Phage Phass-1]